MAAVKVVAYPRPALTGLANEGMTFFSFYAQPSLDGAPTLCIEMAQSKAYTALFGVSTQDFFNFIQGDPSLLAGIPTLARVAAWGGGFPIKVDGEIVGAIGLSGAPTVQNDVDCARAALALLSDAVPDGLNRYPDDVDI